KAVIDGSNALYLSAPREPRPNIKNVYALAEAVESLGLEAVIVFDPGIRPLMTDIHEFEDLLSDPRVICIPDGQDPGILVLETAIHLDALIVSNNTYAEYSLEYDWIESRRIPVAIINGAIILLWEHKFKRVS